jgi:hypothetical protein
VIGAAAKVMKIATGEESDVFGADDGKEPGSQVAGQPRRKGARRRSEQEAQERDRKICPQLRRG